MTESSAGTVLAMTHVTRSVALWPPARGAVLLHDPLTTASDLHVRIRV